MAQTATSPVTRERPASPPSRLAGALSGDWWALGVFALTLAIAPLVQTTSYYHGILVTFTINLILLIGLNLIAGYANQLSLGHAGFYGLGAYTAGIVSVKLGWPPVLGLLLAPLVVASVSLLVGLPTLRLRGLYFSMATLGLGTVLFLGFGRAVPLTGGPNGLLGVPRFSIGELPLIGPLPWYCFGAVIAFLGLAATRNLLRSRVGRGLRGLGLSEAAAAAVGVDAFRSKLAIFSVTAGYAGIAGAIQVFQARFVSPEPFNFFTTVILVVMMVLSGAGTVWGPVVGALMLTGLDEILTGYQDLKPLVLGVVFLVVLRLFPRGIVGGIEHALAVRRDHAAERAREPGDAENRS